MASNGQIHHEINYIEFSVVNMTEAQEFYRDAFGWSFTEYGPGYSGIQKSDGGEIGGLRLSSVVATGGPLVILYSHDLDESLLAVRRAGGHITLEPFDFPGGRRFHFTDPSGNELAVWSER